MTEARRTAFALAAVEFAKFFKEQFADFRIGTVVPYTPSLTLPEGMSTGGGAQSVQHITLQSSTPGAPPLTVGWVNRRSWNAQIRTFGCLEEMHRQRFPNRRFDLDAASYQTFIEKAQVFLDEQGMTVQLESSPPAPLSVRPPAASKNQGVVVMLIGIFVGFLGVAMALYLALHKK